MKLGWIKSRFSIHSFHDMFAAADEKIGHFHAVVFFSISLSFQSLQSRFSCHWEPCKLCMQSTRFSHGFHEMWGHYNVTSTTTTTWEDSHKRRRSNSDLFKDLQMSTVVLDHKLFQIKSSLLQVHTKDAAKVRQVIRSNYENLNNWSGKKSVEKWLHSFSRPVIFLSSYDKTFCQKLKEFESCCSLLLHSEFNAWLARI